MDCEQEDGMDYEHEQKINSSEDIVVREQETGRLHKSSVDEEKCPAEKMQELLEGDAEALESLSNQGTQDLLSAEDEKSHPPDADGIKDENWETIEDFGYQFNEHGQLRHIITKEPFEFNYFKERAANQHRYECLGEVIEQHIYQLLQDEGLTKINIPTDNRPHEPHTFIFRSPDSFKCDKLLLLIHGSGAVRAGQWARRLIINHSLESGTQLPYIRKARQLGYGVLVLNTNNNHDRHTRQPIRGSSCPEEHFLSVWEEFVKPSKAQDVAIVAHSYGGVVTTRTAAEFTDIMKKTFAVAFTDSVHYRVKSTNQKMFNKWMKNNVRNWVSSKKALDTPLGADPGDGSCVSAGTSVHEETSWMAFESVWNFIESRRKDQCSRTDPTCTERK